MEAKVSPAAPAAGDRAPDVASVAVRANVAVPVPSEQARRWASERKFFDGVGAKLEEALRPFSKPQLARYVERPGRIYDKEFRFRLLGDLRGKRLLDLGCGDGSNAVLLAKRGAEVEGIDLSPKLVAVAEKRAELDGVGARARFQCAPVERVDFPEASFDVIWGDGILHHLIDVLDGTLERLVRWAKPGGLFLFSEPVTLSPLLHRLRRGVPIHTDATPDERPLGAREMALVRRHLPGLRTRQFEGLSRLSRFVIDVSDYEGAPWPRRAAVDLLHAIDYALLSAGPLRRLGGMSVIWARRPGGPSPTPFSP